MGLIDTSHNNPGSEVGGFMVSVALAEVSDTLGAWWRAHANAVPGPASLTPDAVLLAAGKAGFGIKSKRMGAWETRDDHDLLAELVREAGTFKGELVLVTEASFGPDVGAFRFDAAMFPAAIGEHQRRYEPVFNGDVLLLVLAEKRILCVHHENHLFQVTLQQQPA